MALKATIFKAELQIADMERNYYQDHALTIARHPSETDERMMLPNSSILQINWWREHGSSRLKPAANVKLHNMSLIPLALKQLPVDLRERPGYESWLSRTSESRLQRY